MPERNVEYGKFGARSLKGSEAVGGQLDALADSPTARQGLVYGLAPRMGRAAEHTRSHSG